MLFQIKFRISASVQKKKTYDISIHTSKKIRVHNRSHKKNK